MVSRCVKSCDQQPIRHACGVNDVKYRKNVVRFGQLCPPCALSKLNHANFGLPSMLSSYDAFCFHVFALKCYYLHVCYDTILQKCKTL
ncbi:hypothetical protein T4C_13062 [Trichinella pseudospiralis]|uniref:Uncharacterized protein n=1 Tax=Trichinella pseudospiralis TaxID=6337 RepID=A0A0V1JVP5_TRIPS|nr:hypothetical protein T4C_13062 [Trichinella pseudospiralis]